MENSFSQIITGAKSIVILLPTNPYLDQVAGALALYLSLKGNHDVSIVSPSPMLVEFNRLVGVDKIKQELGNKNLVIKLVNYKADGIERVTYDLEGDEIHLKVIPKPQVAPPTKEQINITYAGVASDLAILIGGGNESHFPALNTKDFLDVKLAHIGTRELKLSSQREIHSFARPVSSICEIIAHLIQDNKLTLNDDIATNLMTGVEEGSRNFTGLDVSADTFALFADLMRAGGRRIQKVSDRERRSFPPGSIPGEKIEKENAPKSWFEPKIYKGTSGS